MDFPLHADLQNMRESDEALRMPTALTVISERTILHGAFRWLLESECAVDGVPELRQLNLQPLQKCERILVVDQTQWTAERVKEAVNSTNRGVILWLPLMSPQVAASSFDLGVQGILEDRSPKEDIQRCVSAVNCGGKWMPPDVCTSLVSRPLCHLSPRERQIISLVASGLSNKEISYSLGVTLGTIKVYMSRIFTKVGVSDRYELTLFALETMGRLPRRLTGDQPVSTSGDMRLQTFPQRVFTVTERPSSSDADSLGYTARSFLL